MTSPPAQQTATATTRSRRELSPAVSAYLATTPKRTARMAVRVNMVADLVAAYGLPHGMRTTLADMFDVSEANEP